MAIVRRSKRVTEADAVSGLDFVRTIPALNHCICGNIFEIYDPFAESCPNCRREYNGCGQLLAPRSQWGEETGEVF